MRAIGKHLVGVAVMLLIAPGAFAQEWGAYETLRRLDTRDVKSVYAELSAKGRHEVWTAHLVTFLADHPELDDNQRDVVLQALGLLATGILEIDHADPRWQTHVAVPLQRVMARAKELLPRELVVQAFYRLGERNPNVAEPRDRGRLRTISDAQNCDCSTIDGCEDPNMICQSGGPRLCTPVPSYNCGPFFNYACDGMCGY